MSNNNLASICDTLSGLTILEAAELVKILEEKWGVSAAAPVAVAAAAAGGEAAPAAAEQTEFEVVLKEVGAKKIEVIKAVREITKLELPKAKELVDGVAGGTPKSVVSGVNKQDATKVKDALTAAGATVELK